MVSVLVCVCVCVCIWRVREYLEALTFPPLDSAGFIAVVAGGTEQMLVVAEDVDFDVAGVEEMVEGGGDVEG